MGAADIAALKKIGFFAELSDFDLTQIAEITEAKTYKRGEVIVEERTAAERFFIIAEGKIEITKRFADGEQFVLAVHSNGEFFGEMALLDEGLRSATVRAVEDTSLLEISRTDFETLLYKAPVLAYRILRELSSRLRETGALLVSYLESRNLHTYRVYLQTVTSFLRKVEGQEPGLVQRVERLRFLARAAGHELQLPEEEVLNAEIGVILKALEIPPEPPVLPAPAVSRATRLAAACEAFGELLAGGGRPSAGAAAGVQKRLGPLADEEIAATFLKLWQSGRLKPSQ
jgi:CRP-like cAMP-binding protein